MVTDGVVDHGVQVGRSPRVIAVMFGSEIDEDRLGFWCPSSAQAGYAPPIRG